MKKVTYIPTTLRQPALNLGASFQMFLYLFTSLGLYRQYCLFLLFPCGPRHTDFPHTLRYSSYK